MSAALPPLDLDGFAAGLAVTGAAAPAAALPALHAHYDELRRWNPRLSLVGPGAVGELFTRHYAESLAALPHLPDAGTLLDVGSGGGFPGLVLAAARPSLRVVLTETRQRKWAFLRQAARRAALSVEVLDARVAAPLPANLPAALDAVTSRAVALPAPVLAALAARLAPGGVMVLWTGAERPAVLGLELAADEMFPGSRERHLLVLRRAERTT